MLRLRPLRRLLLATLVAASATALPVRASESEPVTVFAAASLTNVLAAVAESYREAGHGTLRLVHAGSSTLAKQIAQGAPADLFLSANPGWMDYLAERAAIDPQSRVPLLGNGLVLIAPRKRAFEIVVGPGFPLASALGERRLAMADPAHVPAGLYARAALEHFGVWADLAPKAAFTADVRGTLALVGRGGAGAGIVYRTDAAMSRHVAVLDSFPSESHPPIRYPLALVIGRDRPAVRRAYDFLRGPEARAQFETHGFTALTPSPSG